jgi:hypothetical protein
MVNISLNWTLKITLKLITIGGINNIVNINRLSFEGG